MKATVISDNGLTVLNVDKGENLLTVLRNNSFSVTAHCGGNGKCGKCKVVVMDGDTEKTVLACQTFVSSDVTVKFESYKGEGLITDTDIVGDGEDGVGLALDVGTTTLAFYFVDLKSGKTIKTYSVLNPQSPFGADVISRIQSATTDGEKLHSLLIDEINSVIVRFCDEFNFDKINSLAVTGNTVMQHLFVGEDVSGLGHYPFTPVFLEEKNFNGEILGIKAEKVYVTPSFDSFVGGDIVSGGIATDILNGNNMLVDLGTNGEIILSVNGKLYTTSVAAGPAFEGADIECGTGGVSGAINKVFEINGKMCYTTVDGVKPTGICGAGLIDAVAYLLDKSVVDETGAFTVDEDRFYVSDEVYVSNRDIRKVQLAKSAVRSGIEILLKRGGISYDDVDNLFLSGGLGYYINKENAIKIGLIPKELSTKTVITGNTAGIGAKKCLLSENYRKKARELSAVSVNVDLSTDVDFLEEFTNNMTF